MVEQIRSEAVHNAKARSVMFMALSNALHFAGYEVARSGLMAMVTSDRGGFESASTLSLAAGSVSPFCIFLLWTYTKLFDSTNPRFALRCATLLVSTILASSSIVLRRIDDYVDESRHHKRLSKGILFALFVAQNGFVQLLFTQHWSFITSLLKEEEGAVWFAPIAGFGSVASSAIAWLMLPVVDRVGLTGMLLLAALIYLACSICSDLAYDIAGRHGFAPSCSKSLGFGKKELNHIKKQSLITRAKMLFERCPVLAVLSVEVFLSQCQSSLLSFLFLSSSKSNISNDQERARFTGTFYSGVNLSSAVLQFGVLPFLLKRVDERRLWLIVPLIMLSSAVWTLSKGEYSLSVVAVTFGIFKALEYSLRSALTEMIFVSLDDESRFLGKEIVSLVANRLGKSGTAICLALVTSHFGTRFHYFLPRVSAILASTWLVISFRLIGYLSTKKSKSD